jgi:dihydropteroate synthase
MSGRDESCRALIKAAEDRSRPPLLMGILNVTPDSFSDGGRFPDADHAVAFGLSMAAQGADLIDVGGESTRPGAPPVSEAEERERVIPVIRALAGRTPVPISIDTRRSSVAEAALEAGAVVVNDVSGFNHDPQMPFLLGRERPIAVAMHMRGSPADMQTRTGYKSLVADCVAELWTGARRALDAGLPTDHLWLDPGIGFAKDAQQSLALLANLDAFVALGRPILVGVSRKAFLGRLTNVPVPAERAFSTAAAVTAAILLGARILRVHDVAAMRQVIQVAQAIRSARADVLEPREVRP